MQKILIIKACFVILSHRYRFAMPPSEQSNHIDYIIMQPVRWKRVHAQLMQCRQRARSRKAIRRRPDEQLVERELVDQIRIRYRPSYVSHIVDIGFGLIEVRIRDLGFGLVGRLG